MKKALISVKGFQYIDNDESCIELKTTGTFAIKDNKFYVFYNEEDENGQKTHTMLNVADTTCVLQRSGAVNNRMVIEVGKRNSCLYSTPVGEMVLDIYGEQVKNNLRENGGTISLIYTLNINSATVGKNRIEITVKEV